MKRPGRLLAVSVLLGIPSAQMIGYADDRWNLGPDATFWLVIAVGLILAYVALRIVEGPVFKPPRDDRERR
jgi:hypothetical protein